MFIVKWTACRKKVYKISRRLSSRVQTLHLFAAFSFLLLLMSCASTQHSQTVVTSYGKAVYRYTPSDGPTVIFEAGLADDMHAWDDIYSRIEKFSGVFAYNRAGFSGSESINKRRDAQTINIELRELLAAVGISPPYILVGHSVGGAYMELYAKTYPEEVAGLILIDPNDARFPDACKKAQLGYCDPPVDIPWWAAMFFPEAVAGEIRALALTHEQVRGSGAFADEPMVILSAGEAKANLDKEERKRIELMETLHVELVRKANVAKHLVCETCGHYVHHDKPELIIEAIAWVKGEQY